ncbi:class I SAM-dependent methyltransferase [Vibrio spartinae]|uniref:Ubiquinone/menaquinone biosynthesis methyltransferase n=1 Tax=Vibrio spartinae TaxID=1918945 RepID=A0ABX6R5N7_9VIBR|nr:class I SAM-dependent methyltransferase [Vibrio spartinae]QMV16876.1 ubiquinone/menaquinone biosynthesis methyltransferase [Vibrio spartinae]
MNISFSEPERLKEIFDSENREEWQRTSHIIRSLALKEHETIADIGAGTGYFSNLFAQIIRHGKVYAIDCEPNMVAYMQERFSGEAFAQIEIILSQRDNPCIPADAETVFIANTYRFIQERDAFLQKMREQTSRGTKFVLVDYKGSNARVSPQQAMDEVRQAGFEVVNFDTEGCPDHYILTFKTN